MEITKPQDKSNKITLLSTVISLFEEQFKEEDDDCEYYHLVIKGEYNRATCDEVQKQYLKAGWGTVVCKTSGENGERRGLTGLQLWR